MPAIPISRPFHGCRHKSLDNCFRDFCRAKGKAAATAPTRVCSPRGAKTAAVNAIAAAARLDAGRTGNAARPARIAIRIKTDAVIPCTMGAEVFLIWA